MFGSQTPKLKIRDAKQALQRLLGSSVETSTPQLTFPRTIEWYEIARVSDALPIDEDGDMLLYQWGTHDWGDGPNFELNLTRQFIRLDRFEEPDIWQLQLIYRYSADDELRVLGVGEKWCARPADIRAFREFVAETEGLKLASQRSHSEAVLILDHV